MEVMFTPEIIQGPKKKPSPNVSLNKMVSRLLCSFQPAAVRHNSFFLNEIPAGLVVKTDRNMLAAVVSEILSSAIRKSRSSCIHISAKQYSDIILLRIKDSSSSSAASFEYNWREINSLVERLGGCITTGEIYRKTSTITLSFRNLANVA